MSIMGFGLLSLMMYRYYSLHADTKYFDKIYALPCIFLFSIIYTAPAITTDLIAVGDLTKEFLISQMREKAPMFVDIVSSGACAGFTNTIRGYFYLLTCGILVCIIYTFGIYYSVRSVVLLRKLQSSLSATTYAAQKQFLVSVFVQSMIPFVCFIVPVGTAFIVVACGLGNGTSKEKTRE
uniref:Uncharacterized protein n=1 Tax=Panagrolaimus sp. JU765 TaxID=591449 RepID=A0AC34RH06_9BILA